MSWSKGKRHQVRLAALLLHRLEFDPMQGESTPSRADPRSELEQPKEAPPPGLIREFCEFLAHNKKWWLIPLMIIVLMIGLLATTMISPAAPLIYPFF